MRVGIITDAFPPEVGGIQTFANQYVTHLAAAEEVDHVEVLAFVPGRDERRDSVSIRRVDRDNTLAKLATGLKWATTHEFDVLHSLTLYPGGLVAALYGRCNSAVNTYATVYGLDAISVSNHPILGFVHRFIFASLDEVLFFSDSTREKTHDTYDASFDSRRIYPGAPVFPEDAGSDPLADWDLPDAEFVVVTVARLVKRKGIDDLIAAVADCHGVALWIVGDGPERGSLKAQVPDHAANRIAFLGEIDHDCLPHVYRRVDAFCMPSVYLRDEGDVEGLGLVFLEAQQFGLPVIGTRSGGIPEALADGETGFLVDERASDEIAECITKLRDDEDLYHELSSNARSFVAEQFAWEDCVANHLSAYQS